MSKACYNCPSNMADCLRSHCLPGDGNQKMVYTVNRMLPGPSVVACHNDMIVVEVRNTMMSESTTIHWHGFKQKNTPYMDGVPFVTQCPIQPGETFQYIFNASQPGTYFWHSHIGTQRSDGLFGPLIILPYPSTNIHRSMYDVDVHRMIINDWMVPDGATALIKTYHQIADVIPTTIIINGLGRVEQRVQGNRRPSVLTAAFAVEKGKRYRFRLIDAGAEDCPIEMSIDRHTMTIINVDSNPIQPVEVDAITIWPGERVDFILNANQDVNNYWIRYRGYGRCQDTANANNGIFQVATLQYKGAPLREPTGAIGYNLPPRRNNMRVLNPYQKGTESAPIINVNIPDLSSISPDDPTLRPNADVQLFVNFDFYPLDNYDFHRQNLYGFNQVASNMRIGSLQFNNINLKLQSFPLLSQRNEIRADTFCNSTNLPARDCTKTQCACTHVLQVGLNQVVEVVFVDEGRYGVINHPLHLHGHFFRVIATENLNGPVTIERVKQLDRLGRIKRRLDRPPLKDTMKAPGGGYTIVRFYADNPGYWFFHCHFEQHTAVGMALVFKVGEHSDFPPVPRGFPKCGSYKPVM
ncbi:laccase-like [Trichogramma pretiosum]|uniref:laccase-like n=1 Tax=Trichogramma pretiosum TaxID=7493 RepID=UPI000C71A424|nr:laccase-like [Trichogramma pretiosum]